MFTRGNPHSPPLVFLHGFLGSKNDWEELIAYLERDFYCIAFDFTSLDQVLQLTPSGAHCVGYSMGGRAALHLRDHFATLFALSAHPGLTSQEEREIRAQEESKWMGLLLSIPFEQFLLKWYDQPLFAPLRRKKELFELVLNRRREQNPQAMAELMMQIRLSEQPLFTHFSQDVHWVCGEEDWKYRNLYATIGAKMHVVKNAGHALHLENPAECARIILEAIDENS